MKLTVFENKLPLKGYPEQKIDEILNTQFKYWISNLLSLKADKEENVNNAISCIKKKFWSLGLDEIKKAFEMYAMGELDIEPRSNHIDIILVGQIFNAYKKYTRVKPSDKTPEDKEREYKALQDQHYVITLFDYWVQHNNVPTDCHWVYTYLEERLDNFRFSAKEKKDLYKMGQEQKTLTDEEIKQKCKRILLMRYFAQLHAKGKHIKDMI